MWMRVMVMGRKEGGIVIRESVTVVVIGDEEEEEIRDEKSVRLILFQSSKNVNYI